MYISYLWLISFEIRKDPDAVKDWGQEEEATEDEMGGWPPQLNGHEFEQALGDGEGQGRPACCSPWGHKELETTKWLNNDDNWVSGSLYQLGANPLHLSLSSPQPPLWQPPVCSLYLWACVRFVMFVCFIF